MCLVFSMSVQLRLVPRIFSGSLGLGWSLVRFCLLRLLTKTVCSTVCSHEWCSVVMIVGLGGPEGGMNNTLMFEIKSDKCTQNNRFSRSPSKRIKPVTSNQ